MRHRLLLVDDDEAISFAIQRYFEMRGFEVQCAGELEEAQALLSHFRYDVVVADLRLTGVHAAEGLDLISDVRQRAPSTHTVLLTAYGSPELESEARRRGAEAVIHKPTPLSELARLINSLLEGA